MNKAKPFLLGTALGASAIFVALQYHVVHSHDGFQIVPRTPQQSIGLAYADIRTWSASQWTDRPELARALMAHGASDLISASVTSTLAETVSEESSTLEELRSFLNRPDPGKQSGSDSDLPETGATRDPEKQTPENDLFRIPFPQDAKTAQPADPFRVVHAASDVDAGSRATGSRFSASDVLEGLNVDPPAKPKNVETPAAKSPAAAARTGTSSRSVARQAQEMEDRIFGRESKANGKPAAESTQHPDPPESMFEDVSTQLENRAQEALNRARQVGPEKTHAATDAKSGSSGDFIRNKVNEVIPDAVKSVLSGAAAEPSSAAPSLLKDFDPFLE